ncbi:hypothetical protein EVAR_29572_1 [Eumeta japonica]|uniref:Uncharacterized protein n=1 Tax=Eumeta variegata TaxID=151549 RepID=A0A4C1VT41_EUMVA|nr:hypothetical protein EVAR_29572_1 [Eumeta japonica]
MYSWRLVAFRPPWLGMTRLNTTVAFISFGTRLELQVERSPAIAEQYQRGHHSPRYRMRSEECSGSCDKRVFPTLILVIAWAVPIVAKYAAF